MTSDFEGFSIADFIHYIYFPILILEEPMKCALFPRTKEIPHKKVLLHYIKYNQVLNTTSKTKLINLCQFIKLLFNTIKME